MAYFKKITASADDCLSGQKTIIGARLVAGANTTTAILFKGTQAGADDFCKLSVLVSGDEDSEYFGDGIIVESLGVTFSGASPILYIYYE